MQNESSAVDIYDAWIQSATPNSVDKSILSYDANSLNDTTKCAEFLYPLLRFNMLVINFWLSHSVYPNEVPLYEKKLKNSAMDLYNEYVKPGSVNKNNNRNEVPNTVNEAKEILKKRTYTVAETGITGIELLEQLAEEKMSKALNCGIVLPAICTDQLEREKCLKLLPNDNFLPTYYIDSQTFDQS